MLATMSWVRMYSTVIIFCSTSSWARCSLRQMHIIDFIATRLAPESEF